MTQEQPQEKAQEKSTRRDLFVKVVRGLGTLGAVGGGIGAVGLIRSNIESPIGVRGELGIVRPPGAVAEEDFLARCIRCTRCADVCDTSCIKLFGAEAGVLQGTPYIVPLETACNMCMKCMPACPCEALIPLEKKEDIKMGTAVVDDRLCVSINGTGVCGACHTACPLRNSAIKQGMMLAPEVISDVCTGCGLCEEFCIVDDRDNVRAIQIKTDRLWPAERKPSGNS